jgi:hypothetical protein
MVRFCHGLSGAIADSLSFKRLLEYAPLYYELSSFPEGEVKRALLRAGKKSGRIPDASNSNGKKPKKAMKKRRSD